MHKGDSRKKALQAFLFKSDSVGDSSEEEIPEEIEYNEKLSASFSSKDSPTHTSEKHEENERSWHKDILEAERKAKSAFRNALEKEKHNNYLLRKGLKREQNSNSELARTLKNEKAKNHGLRIEMELMTKHVDDLCKMLERKQCGYTKVMGKLRKMTAKHEKDKKAIEMLKKDLEATLHQHKKQIAELEKVACDQVQKLKDQVTKMQEEIVEKDCEITSLLLNSQILQQDIDAKGATVSTLQEKVSQLASESIALRRDLKMALNQRQISLKELEVTKETSSTNRGIGEKEKACFQRVYRKLQTQSKMLSERTKALDKSLATEKCLRVSLKKEQEDVKKMLLQHETQVKAIKVLSYEQKEAFAASDCLQSRFHSLRMENSCIMAKYKALETEYDRLRSQYHSISEPCEELESKNNDLVFENQAVKAKLRDVVDQLRQCKLECSRSQTQLQKALREEKERCSEFEQRAEQAADALQKQRSIFEKHSGELENALTKQLQLMDEKQTLSAALQNALDGNLRLKEQQEEEAAFHFQKLSDAEFKLQQEKRFVEGCREALYQLQEAHTDVASKHIDLNSKYQEVLKLQRALQVRHERLCYTKGNARPEMSLPLVHDNWWAVAYAMDSGMVNPDIAVPHSMSLKNLPTSL